MTSLNTNNRNETVDIIRCFAIILVVLGHTISILKTDYQDSIVYSIIWTLQMPLFMIISGYVTKYSQSINDIKTLWIFLKRKTRTYLFPMIIWTIIRGLVFENRHLLNLHYILWHMDSGYWFLSSLWTICLIFGISQFLSSSLNRKNSKITSTILTIVFILGGASLLVCVGLIVGINFFGIKLSLYYMPFFLVGYFYSILEESVKGHWFVVSKEVIPFLSALAYFYLLVHFNIVKLPDDFYGICIRIVASFSGCIMVFGWGANFLNKTKDNWVHKRMVWIGTHTLEIYILHYLLLAPFKPIDYSYNASLWSDLYVFINFLFTIIATCFLVGVIDQNKIAKTLLFAKRNRS